MTQTRSESIAHFALLNALWISLTVQDTALMTIAVPSAINTMAPGAHVEALAFLAAVSNLAGMLVPPLAGWFSDGHRRNGGTRRAWVLAGVAVDVAALIALAFTHQLAAFDALFIVAVAAENVAIAAYQALIPEIVPRSAWGAASGMRGAATLAGTVAGLSIAGSIAVPGIVFAGTAALLVLGSLTLFGFSERGWREPERISVVRWHDFIVVFVARSFIFFGLALLMTFVLYFFQDVLHAGNPGAGTAFVGICSLLGAIISSVALGVLSDRYSRKAITAWCGVPMAIAATGFAVAPNPNVMLVFAVLFGIGLGGILSVGWALAIDSLPQLTDVARDLGIWGIATNLPGVIAPLVGGWVLHALGGGRAGYQTIFALAGISFACGSLAVLRVGARPLSPLWSLAVRIPAVLAVYAGMRLRHRVRRWGSMRRYRGSTLLLVNHQIELEPMVVVSDVSLHFSLRHPVFAATGRRMWEPGFFAVRFPWMRDAMRRVGLAPLFRSLGFMPIENDIWSRSVASYALSAQRAHGALPLERVFTEDVAGRFPPGTQTADLWNAEHFTEGQSFVRLSKVREPYRSEIVREMRDQLKADTAAMEDVVKRGATFFLTPEGRYTRTGELLPLRGLLPRLARFAQRTYVAGVSYDIFRGRRTSILYCIREANGRDRTADELRIARPVTVTQLLAAWIDRNGGPFTDDDAIGEVGRALDDLPAGLFVDPELRNAAKVTRQAIAAMLRSGLLRRDETGLLHVANRTHPRFPLAADIYAYHARFLRESVEAATRAPAARA